MLVIALAFAAAGQLMGFAKGFAMAFESEAYLDELLVGADFRGMRLAPQLMLTFLDACDKQLGGRVQRVRLQCKRGEKMVGDRRVNLRERVYKPMGVDQEWEVRTDGEWAGVGPSDDGEYVMLHGTGEGVRRAVGELVAGKQLPASVSFHAHLGRRAAVEANATGTLSMALTIPLKACDKWDFQVHAVAPTLENGWTLLGEPSKWVPVSNGESVYVPARA